MGLPVPVPFHIPGSVAIRLAIDEAGAGAAAVAAAGRLMLLGHWLSRRLRWRGPTLRLTLTLTLTLALTLTLTLTAARSLLLVLRIRHGCGAGLWLLAEIRAANFVGRV